MTIQAVLDALVFWDDRDTPSTWKFPDDWKIPYPNRAPHTVDDPERNYGRNYGDRGITVTGAGTGITVTGNYQGITVTEGITVTGA